MTEQTEPTRIVLATNNDDKIREILGLQLPGIEFVTLRDLGVESDPKETGATFEANALLKAQRRRRQGGATRSSSSSVVIDVRVPRVRVVRHMRGEGACAHPRPRRRQRPRGVCIGRRAGSLQSSVGGA